MDRKRRGMKLVREEALSARKLSFPLHHFARSTTPRLSSLPRSNDHSTSSRLVCSTRKHALASKFHPPGASARTRKLPTMTNSEAPGRRNTGPPRRSSSPALAPLMLEYAKAAGTAMAQFALFCALGLVYGARANLIAEYDGGGGRRTRIGFVDSTALPPAPLRAQAGIRVLLGFWTTLH